MELIGLDTVVGLMARVVFGGQEQGRNAMLIGRVLPRSQHWAFFTQQRCSARSTAPARSATACGTGRSSGLCRASPGPS
eukprot:5160454-Pyramimonas_sp.AAC.1